ncbi:MAG TPA: hypothetical protein VGJ55_07200 [Pyrinomonadaceae bacterium]
MLTRLQKVLNCQTRRGNHIFHGRYSKDDGAKNNLKPGSKVSSVSLAAVAITALVLSMALIAWPALTAVLAADPGAGTLSPAGPSVSWNGLAVDYANPVSASEKNCQDGTNCDTFKLTISGTQADWAGKAVHIQIDWLSPTFDYALSVHKGTNADPSIAYSDNPIDSPRNWEAVDIDPSVSGVGDYSVHVIYFTTAASDPYKGTASITVKPAATPTPTPPPVSTESPARYFNYHAPEGLGTSAGEPSIGVNPKSGKVFFESYTQTLRVTFDDTASPARTTWEDKSAPNAVTSLDPILFTDQRTGRTFTSQLAGVTSLMSFTDDDGDNWTPSQGAGIPASVDHQTVGGGPFAPPLTRDASSPLYKDAVYYCSQDVGFDASCAVSLDGGLTFGPAVRIYTELDCDAGLHGHIKVAADGTAYVPSKGCGGQQAVVVSENNGLTWEVRKVPGSKEGESDPSVGIGADGAIYFAYANGDGHQRVAVSRDKGKTWPADLDQDLGYYQGIQNSVFPAAVAGDDNRAAVFFLGSATPGTIGATGPDPAGFTGTWYGYISTTYDGGKTWTTVNATPNDPVQRGPICTQGTLTCTGTTRNLLDFNDVTIDGKGRVLAAYADGCVSAQCVQGNDLNGDGKLDGNDNDGSEIAAISRQSGGKGLFLQSDSELVTNLPGAPNLVAQHDGKTAYLSWSTPDDGGSAITAYKVYRGTSAGETLLATVAGDVNSYNDATFNGGSFYYRVRASNANGDGPLSTKVTPTVLVPPIVETPCKLPGVTVVRDSTGDSDGVPGHDVEFVSVAELYQTDGSQKLYFTLKVGSLDPVATPNTSWKVLFKAPDGITHFVEMNTFNPSAIKFRYGHIQVDPTTGVNNNVSDGDLDPASNFKTDGTITLVIANSKVGNPGPGQSLVAIKGEVRALLGATAGLLVLIEDTGVGSYTVAGNDSCAPKPAAPTGLTAVNSARSAVTLNWQDNSDNEQSFLVERSTSVDSGYAQIASVGANTTSYVDGTVVKKVTYYYRVRAANGAAKSGYSNVASVRVKK